MTVQLISSPGCHTCAEVKKILDEIKPDFPDLAVEEIDMTTPAGQELVQKYGIMASPGIVIDGELFATGGVSKDKLTAKLQSLRPK